MRAYDKRDTYTPGFNYKLSDLHAAVARTQLTRLPEMIERRRVRARRYTRILDQFSGISLPAPENRSGSVFYRYVVSVDAGAAGLMESLAREGVECGRPVYKPLHRYLGENGFPGTEEAYRTALSVPIYPGLPMKTLVEAGRRLTRLLEGIST
jgi:dTDP-4-amino-4,6-dideoxygalactose transaminase